MSKESIQEKLEKVRLSYITTLDEKREDIETHWRELNESWDDETYNSLYMVIHSIAGSAETFGFPELTQRARSVIDQFKQTGSSPLDSHLSKKIDAKIIELLNSLKMNSTNHSE